MWTNVTLLFMVFLLPLSGFIAWAGDRIGHRSGKKRHTLFGLRPRHTATLFTVGSGILIASVSFGLFWLSSESFRIVVRHGEALYRNNLHLKEENTRQAQALRKARTQSDMVRKDLAILQEQRAQAELARDAARAELKVAQAGQKEAEHQFQEAQSNFQQAQIQLNTARNDLAQVSTRFTRVQNTLSEKSAKIAQVQKQLRTAEQRYATAQQRLQQAETRIADAEQRRREAENESRIATKNAVRLVTDAEKRRKTAETEFQTKTAAFDAQLKQQKKQYDDLLASTEKQRNTLATLEKELEQKRAEYAQVAANTAALRGRQITYQVGEEVDRAAIGRGNNVWRIQAMLYALLTTAAKKAELRGAKRGQEVRSVLIPPRPIYSAQQDSDGDGITLPRRPDGQNDVRVLTEDDSVSEAAKAIRLRDADTVVVAYALTNAVNGEPVVVDFKIYPNPVVLEAGTRIAEVAINGDGSRQEIADKLYAFLNREVHKKLVKAGMIPVIKGGDSEPIAGERWEEFTLGGEELLALMEEVRSTGARAKVIAYAARQMRAGDSVSLRFEVKGRLPMTLPTTARTFR